MATGLSHTRLQKISFTHHSSTKNTRERERTFFPQVQNQAINLKSSATGVEKPFSNLKSKRFSVFLLDDVKFVTLHLDYALTYHHNPTASNKFFSVGHV